MAENVFGRSDNVLAAVALVNAIPEKRLDKVVQRVLAALPAGGRAFSAEEEAAMQEAFGLAADQTTLLLQTIAYLFETAVYHELAEAALEAQLAALGCQKGQAATLAKCWADKGAAVVAEIRNQAFFEKRLADVKWRLNLGLAQSSARTMATPNALLELSLESSKSDVPELVQMEFSHAELFGLYTKLEIIQSQLDQLTA